MTSSKRKKLGTQITNSLLALNDEQLKKKMNLVAKVDADESTILQDLRDFLKKNPSITDLSEESEERFKEMASDLLALTNLENNVAVSSSIGGKIYRIYAMNLCSNLIKEYNCKSASEKATAQIVANAYARIIKFSQKLDNFNNEEYLSSEKNGFYTMISKELDRAEKQYIMALNTLRQMKQPPMKVSIKTNTAFVADKQQLNCYPKIKEETT